MPSVVRTITRIQDADDFTGSLTDTYIPVYSTAQGKFVMTAQSGGGGSPGGSTTQVQYNSSGSFAGDAGLTYDAANDALTIAGRIITPVIRPASDSTTAVRVQNAAGTTSAVTIDTTNTRFGINVTPSEQMQVASSNGAVFKMSSSVNNTGTHSILFAHAFQPEHGSSCGIFAVPTGSSSTGYLVLAVKNGTPVTASDAVLTMTNSLVSTQKPFQVSSTSTANASIIVGPGQTINTGTHSVVFRFGGGGDECGLLAEANGSSGDPKRIGIALNTGANVTASDLKLVVDRNGYIGVNVIDSLTSNLDIAASTTTRSSLRIRSGTAPTSPNSGDLWFDGTNLKFYDGSATRTITWS